MIKRISSILIVFIFVAHIAWAQGISVTAEVNSNKIALGQAAQLSIAVSGTQEAAIPQVSLVDGLDIRYLGPTRNVSVVNGQVSSSITFTFTVFPQRVGQFQIPAINVTAKGNNYSTQAIDVEVVDTGTASSPGATTATNLQDKVFLALNPAKSEVYLNEGLPVKIMMFINNVAVRDVQYPQIDGIGFNFDDFQKPSQYKQVIKGIGYDIVEFDTTVYPTRTGSLSLGPATLEGSVVMQSSGRGRGMDSFFDDDFFSSFFRREQRMPITLTTRPVNIHVKTLPKVGQPADFSGAVGQFDFSVNLSPTDLKTGDPITLSMTIQGQGNLKAINFPTVKESDDFKFYEPNIKEDGNKKVLEQVVIPTNHNVKEFPPVEFTYFDTNLKKYRTIKKGPFQLNISESDAQDDFKVVGLDQNISPSVQQETFGQDVIFIKSDIGHIYRIGPPFYRGSKFWSVIVLIVSLWGGAYYFLLHSNRLKTDDVYARRYLAPKQIKKDLAKAKSYLSQNQSEKFYDAIFKALQHYLSNKFQVPAGSIGSGSIDHKIKNELDDKIIISSIKNILDECDAIRYASGSTTQTQLEQTYHRLQETIDQIERTVK